MEGARTTPSQPTQSSQQPEEATNAVRIRERDFPQETHDSIIKSAYLWVLMDVEVRGPRKPNMQGIHTKLRETCTKNLHQTRRTQNNSGSSVYSH